MHQMIVSLISFIFLLFSLPLYAATIEVPLYAVAQTGQGAGVGSINFTDTQYGLLITPNLQGLPAGIHGFHLHTNPSCEDNGMAAGGHFDPQNTNKHLGPYNANGHLGDMPALTVDQNGVVTLPVLAPRLKVADLTGHALMIHEGGDNYSDNPTLGGGGARIYCGVVK